MAFIVAGFAFSDLNVGVTSFTWPQPWHELAYHTLKKEQLS